MGTLNLGSATFQGNSSGNLVDAPPGSILQYQYVANKTQRQVTQTGGTKADIGWEPVVITPRSSTSIIIVEWSSCITSTTGTVDCYITIQFDAGGGYAQVPGLDGNQGMFRHRTDQYHSGYCNFRYPHDHNTSNQISYKIYASSSTTNTFVANWDATFGMFSAMEVAT
jgi:hypothetical protein